MFETSRLGRAGARTNGTVLTELNNIRVDSFAVMGTALFWGSFRSDLLHEFFDVDDLDPLARVYHSRVRCLCLDQCWRG